jgi:hypothetical protein
MKKILPITLICLFTAPSSYAYNNNWVPYAIGGLIAGAVIERAYNPPAPKYAVQPQPVYMAAPVYAPPMYTPPPTYVQTYAQPPAQRPIQPQSSVLYFCGSNGLYYPQTPTCASNWQVLPNYQ